MEHRLASTWAGYTWDHYMALPGNPDWLEALGVNDCKAMVLVSYRNAKAMEGLQRGLWD